MSPQDAATPQASPNKPTRKELRLQIAAQIVASNYEAVVGKGGDKLAERLENVLRSADALIEANDQLQAKIHAQRRAKAEAEQGHD
jgi:hypothetical protein